jgi:predicted RNase H-like HicB family nuclease
VSRPDTLTVRVHREPGEDLWAEVDELPGCFASGRDMNELTEALTEAVSLYLSEPGNPVNVELDVTTEQVLVRTA